MRGRPGGYLGLDVGGSAMRWRLLDDKSDIVSSGETIGFSGQFANPVFRQRAEQAMSGLQQAGVSATHVTAGVTGLSRGTDDAVTLGKMLARTVGASHVTVMSDIEILCHAARDSGADIVLYAGTGSVAAHLTPDGALLTAGGKGVLIDDAGGGYWITVQALRQILRAEDNKPGSAWGTPLGQAIGRLMGGPDWASVRATFYSLDRGTIGRLAVAVGEAAAEGDAVALDILESAGRELAVFARMLMQRTGLKAVALSGGVLRLHPAIAQSARAALADATVTELSSDAALIAARLSYAACEQ
jgi:glucosamine kinase